MKYCPIFHSPFNISLQFYDNNFILWTIILVIYYRAYFTICIEKERVPLLLRTSSNFCTCPKIWKSINSSPPLREGLTVQRVLGQLCIDIFSWAKVLIGEGKRLSDRAKVRKMESEISTKAIPENHDGQVKEDDDEVSYRKVFSQTIHLEGTWVWVGSRCQAKYLKIIKHWLKLYIFKKNI